MTERPDIPEQFHWKPEVFQLLKEVGDPDLEKHLTERLHWGADHWREYRYLEARAKDSKARFNESMQEVLAFLDGKAECEEGSFTLQVPNPRKTLDGEALKQWLVSHGVDAGLVAEGYETCTKVSKAADPFVKFNKRREKKK